MNTQQQKESRDAKFILNTVKLVSYLSIFVFLTMIPIQGHGWQGKTGDAEHRLNLLVQELGLSAEQEETVREVFQEVEVWRQEILTRYGMDRQTMQALMYEMREVRAYSGQWLAEVLTEEQMTELRRLRQERHGGRRKGDQSD